MRSTGRERFEDVVAGIERALAHPDELAQERARAAREVVGEVDGRAASALPMRWSL